MSHFYGVLQGQAGRATRCGSKSSGLTVTAAGWGGAIEVRVWHDPVAKTDHYSIEQIPWQGSGTNDRIARGVIGKGTDYHA